MTLWLVVPVSFLAAIVLAVLAAAAPLPLTWPAPPGGPVLLTGPAVPGGRAIAIAGLLVAGAVVLRTASCLAAELHRRRRDRRDLVALVAATGRPSGEPGVAIV